MKKMFKWICAALVSCYTFAAVAGEDVEKKPQQDQGCGCKGKGCGCGEKPKTPTNE